MSFFTPKHFEDASRVLRGLLLVAARAAADRCAPKQNLVSTPHVSAQHKLFCEGPCESTSLCFLFLNLQRVKVLIGPGDVAQSNNGEHINGIARAQLAAAHCHKS